MKKEVNNQYWMMLILLAIVFVGCCPLAMDYQIKLDIINEADHSIGYYVADGNPDGICNPESLPDTNERVVYDIKMEMGSGVLAHCRSWEQYFENLPCDTLSIFIFHTDTLNKYSWEEVRDGYKILRRYDFGKEDLENLHELVYP